MGHQDMAPKTVQGEGGTTPWATCQLMGLPHNIPQFQWQPHTSQCSGPSTITLVSLNHSSYPASSRRVIMLGYPVNPSQQPSELTSNSRAYSPTARLKYRTRMVAMSSQGSYLNFPRVASCSNQRQLDSIENTLSLTFAPPCAIPVMPWSQGNKINN